MPGWLLYILALALVLLEGALGAALGLEVLTLEIPLALTLYLGLRREFTSSALLLCGLMIPIEWQVGGLFGVYSLCLVLVFGLLRLVGATLERRWGLVQLGLAAVTILAHHLLIAGFLLVTRPGSLLLDAALGTLFSNLLVAVPVAWVVGRALDALDGFFDPRSAQDGLLM